MRSRSYECALTASSILGGIALFLRHDNEGAKRGLEPPLGDVWLERDAPLAQLGGLVRRVARGGPGEVVLLRGEAGVGKTAMLAKFVSQLDFGPRILRGWCDPLG